MQALFVHGMGRSPLSGWRMSWFLKKRGVTVSSFFYTVTFENFPSIVLRLRKRIVALAEKGDFVLVGHSLGGVLIRSALEDLPPGTRLPLRVFMMGSPVRPSRVAKYLSRNWLFWLATRDCGQLLSSEERMQAIAPCQVPTTSFVGTHGIHGKMSPFGNEVNDGVVTASEVAAAWISEEVQVPVVHSLMPSSKKISQLILDRIE
jgi:pimeloyl-ACP methyl ester carboxylesterase